MHHLIRNESFGDTSLEGGYGSDCVSQAGALRTFVVPHKKKVLEILTKVHSMNNFASRM